MEEITILPKVCPSSTEQIACSPSGIEYNMSIRDYQNLSGAQVRVNRKATNRIMGNRKQSPSERDRNEKRKRALGEIFDIICDQEEEEMDNSSPIKKGICYYHDQEIPYTKKTKG